MAILLLVDDDSTLRNALYDMFRDEHECHVAGSAEEALTWMSAGTCDVVLTDISMPGMGGLELLGLIRQQYPETPVVMFSGIDNEQYTQGLFKMGAYDYLVKPFQMDEIEESVKRAISYRRSLEDARPES